MFNQNIHFPNIDPQWSAYKSAYSLKQEKQLPPYRIKFQPFFCLSTLLLFLALFLYNTGALHAQGTLTGPTLVKDINTVTGDSEIFEVTAAQNQLYCDRIRCRTGDRQTDLLALRCTLGGESSPNVG